LGVLISTAVVGFGLKGISFVTGMDIPLVYCLEHLFLLQILLPYCLY
jgi:hypothetical protein